MSASGILARARNDAGLTQDVVARRARTSRPTLSAYEHDRKSPTLDTAQRILAATGHELDVVPRIEFRERTTSRGRVMWVPNRLWRLPVRLAVARVTLPLHLQWSKQDRGFDLGDRQQRARVYETVLREGRPADIRAFVDGALLVDLWHDLVLPPDLRGAWAPVIEAELVGRGSDA